MVSVRKKNHEHDYRLSYIISKDLFNFQVYQIFSNVSIEFVNRKENQERGVGEHFLKFMFFFLSELLK